MVFLLEYDRTKRRLMSLRAFDDSAFGEAEDDRLRLELQRNGEGFAREIVLLQAPSEEALRNTHRRYFEDVEALMRRSG